MEIYTTEEEQVQQIKKWLREYGPAILISILIVVVGTFGWRYWNKHVYTTQVNASNQYEQLLMTMSSDNAGNVTAQADNLIKSYPGTPYAKLAGLLVAKVDVENGKMDAAQKQLNWVITNAESKSIKQIAKNRLARILIAENKAQDAVKLLTPVNSKAYKGVTEAILGDAYVKLGDVEKAKQSYKTALMALPQKSNSRVVIQMKLSNLPG